MVGVKGHGDYCDSSVGPEPAGPQELGRAAGGRGRAPHLVGGHLDGPGAGDGPDGGRGDGRCDGREGKVREVVERFVAEPDDDGPALVARGDVVAEGAAVRLFAGRVGSECGLGGVRISGHGMCS